MIYTNYFYTSKLNLGEYRIRDGHFYPSKQFECFKLWFEYIRKHYPDEHILIIDNDSPISIEEGMKDVGEAFEFVDKNSFKINESFKVHIIKHEQQYEYLDAVAQNIFAGIEWAYKINEDMLWIDTDFFINNKLDEAINGKDFWSSHIDHLHMVTDMTLMFISNNRLHIYDKDFDLIEALRFILKEGYHPRMFSLFEHGLYNLFCFINYSESKKINGAHCSCYDNFLKFLIKNPLESLRYKEVKDLLMNIDKSSFKDIKFNFKDAYYEIQ
jgi:hypothetical protein